MKTTKANELQSIQMEITSASDSNPGLPDTAELVANYRPLVYAIASRFYGMEFDDLVQEGMLGLLSAAKRFDPSQGSSFGSFAALCVQRRMASAVARQQGKRRGEISVSQLSPQEEKAFSKAVLEEDNPENLVILREDIDLWQKRLDAMLSEREGKILRLYLKGWAYQSIAEELGISTKAVDNGLQRIRCKVRDWVEREKSLD